MKYGHLERINVTLRTLSPLFIGSGERYTKKEYIFDANKREIYFPNLPKFIAFLKKQNLLNHYENFLLQARERDLRNFLRKNGINPQEYSAFTEYQIDAEEAAEHPKFHEIVTFIKDAYGLPYIPGSSLKGAIRTAIAAQLIKSGNYNWARRNIDNADNRGNSRNYLRYESNNLERRVFNQLEHKDKNNEIIRNAVNDFMQGIRVSDSRPLEYNNLTLVGKHERKPDGDVRLLPIFRECLKPGSEARLQITLDKPMLNKVGISMDTIEDALHNFADAHYEVFEQYFQELPEDAETTAKQGVDVILGGGAGFVSKTLTYNLYNERNQALSKVTDIMKKQFPPNHGHNKNISLHKVAPHILKTTMYKGQYYQMGRCELIIE
ncbi:MAG TPA: type III-A CRISPR-associated RAMP protein Csm5 [Syntrophomonadaceae bacterium]|nr:type III-A CRISPR-associated RAMP protein Csm5 [Syntrophomonadaceae bacterium]